MSMKKMVLISMVLLTTVFFEFPSIWAAYPERAIKLVIPYSAGGGTDAIGRTLAKVAEKYIDQPIAVENRTGGGGAIAFSYVAKSKPDGYTLCFEALPIVTLPIFGNVKISYKDLDHVAQVNEDPASITVRQEAPWNSIRELITDAKNNPKKIKVGTTSPGAAWWIGWQIVKVEADIKDLILEIPYSGGAKPMLKALAGNEIDVATSSAAEALTLVNEKRIKYLGIMSEDQLDLFKGVPTLNEQGLSIAFGTWRAISMAKGTPEPIINFWRDIIKKVVTDEEFVKFMEKRKFGIKHRDRDEFMNFMDEQYRLFTRVKKEIQ